MDGSVTITITDSIVTGEVMGCGYSSEYADYSKVDTEKTNVTGTKKVELSGKTVIKEKGINMDTLSDKFVYVTDTLTCKNAEIKLILTEKTEGTKIVDLAADVDYAKEIQFTMETTYEILKDTAEQNLYLGTHTHNWNYVADGNELKAYCLTESSKCYYYGTESQHANALQLILSATDSTYTGNVYNKAEVTNDIFAITGATSGAIMYSGILADGTIYESTTIPPIYAGAYKATVTLTVSKTEEDTKNYTIEQAFSIEKIKTTIQVTMDDWTYGEESNSPKLEGNIDNGKETYYYRLSTSEKEEDWTTTLPTNAGNYTVKAVVEDTATYAGGSVTDEFTIYAKSLNNAVITLDKGSQSYTGEDITQNIQSVLLDNRLLATTDYEANSTSVFTAKECGTYTIFISGKGNYTGSAVVTWEISKKEEIITPSPEPTQVVNTTPPSPEPTQVINTATPSPEPTQVINTATPSPEPTQVVNTATPSLKPTEEVNTVTPSLKPTEEASTEIPSTKPTEIVSTVTPSLEPTKEVNTAMPSLEPTKEVNTAMPSLEPTQVVNIATPSLEPTGEISTTTPSPEPTKNVSVVTSSPETIEESKDLESLESSDEDDEETTEQDTTFLSKEEMERNQLAINLGLKVSQTGKQINISWGEIEGAEEYLVYVQYCGMKFPTTATKTLKGSSVTSVVVERINGKKLNLKKNYKIYIIAYKTVDGTAVKLGKTITAHIVGKNNTKYTNVKKVKVTKSKYTLKSKETAMVKASTVLVHKSKKQLTNAHAKELRYATSNKKVATISKTGKMKAVGTGSCIIYIYARNGYTKTIQVTVK